MSADWYSRHKFPISLPGEPLDPLSSKFDEMFIKLQPVYGELDSYIENIEKQHGKFWISSPYGGSGKSTMLSYIARHLYSHLSDLRALPICLEVSKGRSGEIRMPSVQHEFVKNFLKEFLKINSNLRKAGSIFNTVYPEDIRKELQWLDEHKEGIQKFSETLTDLDVEKLTEKFDKILEKGLLPLKERNIFLKYVLLVDEMDKIDEQEVLSFLSGNQGLFERLYSTYGFVAFFAGHETWVERIKIGDEFNYYQGKIFRIPPFVSIDDVHRLIEGNMFQHFAILPSDVPFTEEAYQKLQELTKGIPRRIIVLATYVMNEGAFRKVARIGPGFVEEVVISEEHSNRAMKYLENHIETYAKLKRAMEKRVDGALYLFYNMYNHQILKKFDRDLSSRTRTLGIEWTDDEWNDKVLTLTFIGCLEDKGTYRELSKDIVELFDGLREHPTVIDKVLSAVIRKMGDLKPVFGELPKPDYQEVIDSIFEISSREWFSEAQILDRFSDRSAVVAYAVLRRPKSPQGYIKEEFKKTFKTYLEQNEKNPKLIVVSVDGEQYYRRLPSNMVEEDKIVLRLNSKELIDEYIGLILEMKDCDSRTIKKIDDFFEKTIDLSFRQKGVKMEEGILRTKRRYQLFKQLGFPHELRNRIDFYLRETKGTYPSPNIVREITRNIFQGLFEIYIIAEPVLPASELELQPKTPFTNLLELYDLIGKLRGPVKVLDKDFDTEGFKFFLKLDHNKVSALQILGGRSRLGSTLKEEYKLFKDEMQRRGITVEFRILDDKDAQEIHDRYLISEVVYNTPPWNIINKKLGDIISIKDAWRKREHFEKCWARASDILSVPIS